MAHYPGSQRSRKVDELVAKIQSYDERLQYYKSLEDNSASNAARIRKIQVMKMALIEELRQAVKDFTFIPPSVSKILVGSYYPL